MESLANKYRPQEFEDVCSQKSIISILNKQLVTNSFTNCYLFAGPTGTGKTTIARIFANKINRGLGTPIEIDGASNNGVDNIREIIDNSKARALDAEYKIYIIDEVHMLTLAAWNAFLKCLEEPSPYTIFIFCTTDPQKIPGTIMNRVMRFNLTKIPVEEIENRLVYICEQEGFTNYKESCNFIAKLSCGGMRDAIATLDKCSKYSTDLDIKNVLSITGNLSYDSFFALTNALVDKDESVVIDLIEGFYNSGADLKMFVEQYLDFTLDLTKYCLFKNMAVTKIPSYLEEVRINTQLSPICVKYAVGFDGNINFYNSLVDALLDLKSKLRYDISVRTTVLAHFIRFSRGI